MERRGYFSVQNDKTVDLICSDVMTAIKGCSLHRNYDALHKNKFRVREGKLRGDKLN